MKELISLYHVCKCYLKDNTANSAFSSKSIYKCNFTYFVPANKILKVYGRETSSPKLREKHGLKVFENKCAKEGTLIKGGRNCIIRSLFVCNPQ